MTTIQPALPASSGVTRVTARALLLGDRIEAAGLERSDMISSTPLAFHAGANGFVALYRFGVAVMVGLSPLEEDDVPKQVKLRVSGPHEHIDDESAILEISPDLDDKVPSGGAIAMKNLRRSVFSLSPTRLPKASRSAATNAKSMLFSIL